MKHIGIGYWRRPENVAFQQLWRALRYQGKSFKIFARLMLVVSFGLLRSMFVPLKYYRRVDPNRQPEEIVDFKQNKQLPLGPFC